MYKWYSNFDGLPCTKEAIRRSLVVIAGPSGVGKTTFASKLCLINYNFVVLPNFTTRSQRPTDQVGHFNYVAENTFCEACNESRFFLARLEPSPQYGYMAEQVINFLEKGIRPVLMFRHSGIKYLSEILGGFMTVFIEGDPREVVCHSRNLISPPTLSEVMNTIDANRKLQALMSSQKWPFFRVNNNFRGESELDQSSHKIDEFLSTQHDN